jgi:hypothetical protein
VAAAGKVVIYQADDADYSHAIAKEAARLVTDLTQATEGMDRLR